MSNESADRQRQKLTEFLQFLPLTAEIAGLAHPEVGKHFNEGQMDVRSNTLRNAFRFARKLAAEQSRLMQLAPIAIEIAGLHRGEHGKHFNEGQMEVRAAILAAAFKTAHQLIIGVLRADDPPAGPGG